MIMRRFLLLLLILSLVFIHDSQPSQAQGDLESLVRAAVIARFGDPADRQILVADVQYRGNWAFGNAIIRAGNTHESPRLILFLAEINTSGWTVGVEGTPLFTRYLSAAPAEFMSPQARSLLMPEPTFGNGASLLGLPYPVGEGWYMGGGLHAYTGSGARPWNSLDFGDGTDFGIARAARDGVVYRSPSCPNYIRIDHAGGWSTSYYHLINEIPQKGATVQRGAPLGTISEAVGCGGFATGPHVHFSLWQNGDGVELNNVDIGGWTINEEPEQYEGCMTRLLDGLQRCTGQSFYNSGLVGSDNIPFTGTTWNFDNGLQGWTPLKNLSGGTVNPFGGVGFSVTGSDPYIVSPLLGIDAASYPTLRITMGTGNDACAQVYWMRTTDSAFDESRRVDFAPVGEADAAYKLDMAQNPNWNGTIKRLRIDPACIRNSSSPGIRLVQVKFFAPVPAAPLPLAPSHLSHTGNGFPYFSWTSISGASPYRIFVFDNKVAAERTVDIRENTGFTSIILSQWLNPGRYFWRVRARVNGTWGYWSVRYTLFIEPPTFAPAFLPQTTPAISPPNQRDPVIMPLPTINAPPDVTTTPLPPPPNSR